MSYKSDKSTTKLLNAYNMSPDITLCPGTNCPYKETCYRYTSEPSDWQSYFSEPPIKDGKCDMYWGDNAEAIFNQLKDIVKGKE
jgi:hypothetical protein